MSRVGNATAEKYIYLFASPLTSSPRLHTPLFIHLHRSAIILLSLFLFYMDFCFETVCVCVCVFARGRAFRFLRWIPSDFFSTHPRCEVCGNISRISEFIRNILATLRRQRERKKITNFPGKCRAWVFIVPLALFNFAKICTRFNIIHNYNGILFRWSFLRYKHHDILQYEKRTDFFFNCLPSLTRVIVLAKNCI